MNAGLDRLLQPAPQLPGRSVTSAPRGESDVVLMGAAQLARDLR